MLEKLLMILVEHFFTNLMHTIIETDNLWIECIPWILIELIKYKCNTFLHLFIIFYYAWYSFGKGSNFLSLITKALLIYNNCNLKLINFWQTFNGGNPVWYLHLSSWWVLKTSTIHSICNKLIIIIIIFILFLNFNLIPFRISCSWLHLISYN